MTDKNLQLPLEPEDCLTFPPAHIKKHISSNHSANPCLTIYMHELFQRFAPNHRREIHQVEEAAFYASEYDVPKLTQNGIRLE